MHQVCFWQACVAWFWAMMLCFSFDFEVFQAHFLKLFAHFSCCWSHKHVTRSFAPARRIGRRRHKASRFLHTPFVSTVDHIVFDFHPVLRSCKSQKKGKFCPFLHHATKCSYNKVFEKIWTWPLSRFFFQRQISHLRQSTAPQCRKSKQFRIFSPFMSLWPIRRARQFIQFCSGRLVSFLTVIVDCLQTSPIQFRKTKVLNLRSVTQPSLLAYISSPPMASVGVLAEPNAKVMQILSF